MLESPVPKECIDWALVFAGIWMNGPIQKATPEVHALAQDAIGWALDGGEGIRACIGLDGENALVPAHGRDDGACCPRDLEVEPIPVAAVDRIEYEEVGHRLRIRRVSDTNGFEAAGKAF